MGCGAQWGATGCGAQWGAGRLSRGVEYTRTSRAYDTPLSKPRSTLLSSEPLESYLAPSDHQTDESPNECCDLKHALPLLAPASEEAFATLFGVLVRKYGAKVMRLNFVQVVIETFAPSESGFFPMSDGSVHLGIRPNFQQGRPIAFGRSHQSRFWWL
jgi:hypothetical protein